MKIKKFGICTIKAAKTGDFDAMEIILNHYEPMINRLSTKAFVDEDGRSYKAVDDSIKERIISKLMFQIIYKYEIGGKPEASNCLE